MAQTISNAMVAGWDELHVVDNEHTPHWKVYDKGSFLFRAKSHRNRKDIAFDITEDGMSSSKRVMVELDEIATLALYHQLKRIIEH